MLLLHDKNKGQLRIIWHPYQEWKAQVISAGAFGGSRQGVQQGIAQSKYLDRLAGIEERGRQQAFDKASGLFQADRGAEMDAERLGLGAGQLAGLAKHELEQVI